MKNAFALSTKDPGAKRQFFSTLLDKHNELVRVEKTGRVTQMIDTQPWLAPAVNAPDLVPRFEPSLKILLADGLPLIETLELLETNVRETLDYFEPAFQKVSSDSR